MIGTASLTTTIDPEAWWAAGVNINYRRTCGLNMHQIRNTSGFTGGTIQIYDIVFSKLSGGSDGNKFPDLYFIKEWENTKGIDSNDFEDWNIVPKFGNNIDRKRVMDFFQSQTGSVLKPEFKTWTN